MINNHTQDLMVEEPKHEVKGKHEQKRMRTVKLVGTAIFAAISVLLYITKVPPFVFSIFPGMFSFLEINFSEVPAMIAGFAYGPISGFLVLIIRFLVKLPMTSTLMIGEVADLIYSSSFVVTAALIYKYKRTFKGVLMALGIAFVVQVIVSAAANYFVIYHLYNREFFKGNIPFTAVEFIKIVIPFNIIKNTIIGLLTLGVYKRTSKLINQLVD